jgi:hypothetical protein
MSGRYFTQARGSFLIECKICVELVVFDLV